MGQYRPLPAPGAYSQVYQAEENNRIARAFTEPYNLLILDTLHAPPARTREGIIALADGTDWNPGAGAGVYAYYGGSWNKLG